MCVEVMTYLNRFTMHCTKLFNIFIHKDIQPACKEEGYKFKSDLVVNFMLQPYFQAGSIYDVHPLILYHCSVLILKVKLINKFTISGKFADQTLR